MRTLFKGPVWRKIVCVVLISIMPVLAALLYHEHIHRENIVAMGKREVGVLLHSFSESQRSITMATRALLKTAASMPEIAEGNSERAHKVLQTLLHANPYYTNIILVDQSGDVVAMAKGEPRGLNFSDRKQFRDAMETGRLSYGEFVVGKATGKPIFPFAMPVKDRRDQVRYVILIGQDLSYYEQEYLGMSIEDGTFFGICDHRGIRLYRYPHADGIDMGEPIKRSVFRVVDGEESGVFEGVTSDGTERFIAHEPLFIKGNDTPYMYMFLATNKASVIALANKTMQNGIIVSVTSMVLAILMTWLLARHSIVAGVRRLMLVTERFGLKGERVESGIDYTDGEIGALAHSFDSMTALLQQRERDTMEAKNIAEAANRTKDEFIANISHEVRTPLNGVMGMLQLLDVSRLKGEQMEYVRTALVSSRGLLRIINDLLDFSKIQAGKLSLHEEHFETQAVIREIRETFTLQMEEKRLAIDVHVDRCAQGWFVADVGKLRQILFNLIGNAVKFTHEGHIRIEVYTLPHPVKDERRLFFTIEDTGIGIAEDKLAQVFEPFTQVDGTLSRQYSGAGLGLPIVEKLVNLMGGTCVVESELGKGTTVSFCILARQAAGPPAEQAAKPKSRLGAPLRILLVEDERVNRVMAERLLDKMGYQVTSALNGKECLECLATGTFDVVLMDIQMPVMDGLEATRRIREQEGGDAQRLPIIGLSAHANTQNRDEALAAGMDDYITKPFNMDELEDELTRYSRRREE